MTDTPMLRIKRIEVKKLFNLHDHIIELNLDDQITILHGPNGVGKTVILSMINALFSGKFGYFSSIPFQQFCVVLTNGFEIILSAEMSNHSPQKIYLSLNDGSGKNLGKELIITNFDIVTLEKLANQIPWLVAIADEHWLDERMGDEIDTVELIKRYSQHLHSAKRTEQRVPRLKFFHEVQEQVNIHLIETQRLLRFSPDRNSRYRQESKMVSTVNEYANDLKVRIKEAMENYGQTSQQLEQSYPQRLLTHTAKISAEQLKQRMTDLDLKWREFKGTGILDETKSHPFNMEQLDNLNEAQQNVMALYVQDTQDKLKVLDDLARRIKVFLDNLNRKFQHKTVKVDRQKGLVAESYDNQSLPLDSLSSGEQHELVLIYDFLFKVRQNTLVLIDEPELSLHLSWQKRFLLDLLEIVKIANFDVLMATHSPFIISDRSDLMVALEAEIA